MSAINALAPWFGGKRTLAPAIVAALGDHSAYWEPFCGSMAVLLAKPVSTRETVNDLHDDLVNLARCVRCPKAGPALYRRLRRTLCCQGLFVESLAVVRGPFSADTEPDVTRAYHYFVASWQGMNGVAGTPLYHTGYARRFTNTGGDPGKRWAGVVRSIPAWRRRLEGVMVLSTDGVEVCGKVHDAPGTALYVDPPYLVKGARYVHDFTAADHVRLAAALARFRQARVVVSYYDHADLGALYPGWHLRRVAAAKNLVNQGKAIAGRTEAPEVLLSNLPFPGTSAPGLFDGGDPWP